jgi:signal transduction histidine kinase
MAQIMITSFLFTLSLLPTVYMWYIPFRKFVSPMQKKHLLIGYALFTIAELILVPAIFLTHLLPFSWLSFKEISFFNWLPFFIFSLVIIRAYIPQQIFILGMQSAYSLFTHTLAMNIVLLFIADDDFFSYLTLDLLLYTFLFLLFLPLVDRFFNTIFIYYPAVNNNRFWWRICLLPILLGFQYSFFALDDSTPLAQEHLLPRLLLILAVILIGNSVRIGLKQLDERISLYKKNYALIGQMHSFNQYAQTLQESQRRMAVYRHDRRHQLRLLMTLLSEKRVEEALELIHEIDADLNQTKVETYCKNPMINAALSVYIAQAREQHIPISTELDIPEEMEMGPELSIVLSNLMENAIHASQKQAAAARGIAIVAKQSGAMLNIIVKNRFDGIIDFDKNGLPLAREKGHGLGMRSLILFQERVDANIFCTYKEGWFSTYIQFVWNPQ